MEFTDFLQQCGLQSGMHVLVHSSYRNIRKTFTGITIEKIIGSLQKIITPRGSLIMPAFTYCFKRKQGAYEVFDRDYSPSKVGAVSEQFRQSGDVIRTSSPTHSFCMWGAVTGNIGTDNLPESPLGEGSVLDWLAHHTQTYILLLGVDFRALSFGHYLEIKAGSPWADFSPWEHLQVERIGISAEFEQPLREVPGCSKGFRNFENYLVENNIIKPERYGTLSVYLIAVSRLLEMGLFYYRSNPESLLCGVNTCQACDERWEFYLKSIKRQMDKK